MGEHAPDPSAPTPQDVLIANERVKLSATYLNGLAIAVFAVGGLAPLVGTVSRDPVAAPLPPVQWNVAAIIVLCLSVSGGLHQFARLKLRELRA